MDSDSKEFLERATKFYKKMFRIKIFFTVVWFFFALHSIIFFEEAWITIMSLLLMVFNLITGFHDRMQYLKNRSIQNYIYMKR